MPASSDTQPGPCRVSGSLRAWPLLDVAAARAHEAEARQSPGDGSLMERAGRAVARLAVALAPSARHVTVVCGPGDNGGDGLVAARLLAAQGMQIVVHRTAGNRPPSQDTAAALAALQGAGHHPTPCPDTLACSDLVIDALLGLGADRAPKGAVARAIDAMRASAAPVLSVDLPSGLHPDTGSVLGDMAVVASHTLCALSLRPGCFTHLGRDHAGTVWLDDLGHPATTAYAWLSGAPARTHRPHASHKGRFGDVIVVGGAAGLQGAAVLAAEAALAAGAGRVFLVPLDSESVTRLRPELMLRSWDWAAQPTSLAHATVVAGCGGGEQFGRALPALLAHAGRLVLDADALNAIAGDTALLQALKARTARGRPTVLTPHPLEAARLLGTGSAEVQAHRFEAASALARSTHATVLLKGSGSVIAAPAGPPWVNATGNAALASAGSGDVLAGWIGGLWSAEPGRDSTELAVASAWQHGSAADHFATQVPGRPLRAAALIEQMLLG